MSKLVSKKKKEPNKSRQGVKDGKVSMSPSDVRELYAKSQELVAKSVIDKTTILVKLFNYKRKYNNFRF